MLAVADAGRSLAELVLVGVVSGAGGAVVAALLRIRHERRELVRERMLVAADDFGTGAIQAFIPLRRIELIDRANAVGEATFQERLLRYGDLVDEVTARLARVELLFGVGSPSAVAANQVVAGLSEVRRELETAAPRQNELARHGGSAATHLNQFTEGASRAIGSSPGRDPWRGLAEYVRGVTRR
jgi:hypothetical protein